MKTKYDFQDENTEKKWELIIKIILVPVVIAILFSIIK